MGHRDGVLQHAHLKPSQSPTPPPTARHSRSPSPRRVRRDHIRRRSSRDGSRGIADGHRSRSRSRSRNRNRNRNRSRSRRRRRSRSRSGRRHRSRSRSAQRHDRRNGKSSPKGPNSSRDRVPGNHATGHQDGRGERADRSLGDVRLQSYPAAELDKTPRQQAPLDGPPEVGTIHRAVVASVRSFGVFVRPAGWPQDGLVHASQVSTECTLTRDDDEAARVKSLEYFAPRHSQVVVQVTEVTEDGGGRLKVGCSMAAVDQHTGIPLDPSGAAFARAPRRGAESDVCPVVGSIHAAQVERIAPFGVFVHLPGFRNGLVHSSQVSDHLSLSRDDSDEDKVAALSSVVATGDAVQVKVVEVVADVRGPKVGCSIKLVSQRDGKDLDPNFLKYRPRGQGGGDNRSVPLGAAAGQVKPGAVVDWGHLTGGDTKFVQSRGYELVGDEAGEPPLPPPPPVPMPDKSQALPLPPTGPGPQPAWGKQADARPPEWGAVSSVSEALAIIESRRKKDKKATKEKKRKKDSKTKPTKKEKHKKHKHKQ